MIFGLSRQAASTGITATITRAKTVPKGRKPVLPMRENSQGPMAKPSDRTVA